MMSEDDKPGMDELLSAYLDGQLSDRRHNELKRMIAHDPDLAARVERLRRQQQLLQAVPADKAPPGLAQDILACLERRFILEQYPKITRSSAGDRQLFGRRCVTAAAILLPIGVLGLVLWQILGPVPLPGWFGGGDAASGPVVRNPSLQPAESWKPAGPSVPYEVFSAVLELPSERVREIRSHLEKAIFTNGLEDLCPPAAREATTWTYVVRGPAARVAALLDDLRDVWPLCRGPNLVLHGPEMTQAARIERVTVDQIQQLLAQPSDLQRLWSAERFARLNAVQPPLVGGGLEVEPVKPMLASGAEIREPGGEEQVDASLVVLLRRL